MEESGVNTSNWANRSCLTIRSEATIGLARLLTVLFLV